MEKNLAISNAQRIFITNLVNGAGLHKSASLAGYDAVHAYRLLQESWVNRKLCSYAREYIRKKIDLEGAPAAYTVLMGLLFRETTSDNLKVDIAKFLINHSVPAPKAMDEGGEAEKDISNMTREELTALIQETDTAMVERGLMIDATPAQAFDDII